MKKYLGTDFTYTELIIITAILCLLTIIAIPVYQDYKVRTKVSKVIAELTHLKSAADKYYHHGGTFPSIAELGAIPSLNYASKLDIGNGAGAPYFTGMSVVGNITLTLNNQLDHALNGSSVGFFAYIPIGSMHSNLVWYCRPSAAGMAIAEKYLPTMCRTGSLDIA